jgi:carbonic anhydrase
MRLAIALTLVFAAPLQADGGHCPPDYGYGGFTPPEQWGSFAPLCGEGATQSPVALDDARRAPGAELRFDYRASSLHLENSGHDFRAAIPEAVHDLVFVPGDACGFRLQQFHFHWPNEHQLSPAGKLVAEIHLVHERFGHTVVVAVLVALGEDNAALAPIFDRLPLDLCQGAEIERFDPAALLPRARDSYYTYRGSLTTPPCTEGVDFYVYPAPIAIGAAQLEKLQRFGPNARPVQRNSNPITLVAADGD